LTASRCPAASWTPPTADGSSTLLGQGRATWQATSADPDSLASHLRLGARTPHHVRFVPFDYLECEDIWGVDGRAYEALTGQELTVEITGGPWTGPVDLGEDWDFDDAAEMPSLAML
jgi:hypothetical protein